MELVFHDLFVDAVFKTVHSTGDAVGYTVTTPEDDPGSVPGIWLAWFQVLSPRSSKGDAISSLVASLFAAVSVLVAAYPIFFQR